MMYTVYSAATAEGTVTAYGAKTDEIANANPGPNLESRKVGQIVTTPFAPTAANPVRAITRPLP
jgi:hypothetical protein